MYIRQNVIKLDKANYHAFVFIGLCAKEMQQFDQSRAAYRKAIEQNSEQILAWQVSDEFFVIRFLCSDIVIGQSAEPGWNHVTSTR